MIRIIEMPSSENSGHRKFIEMEWKIDENPLLEAEFHPAFSFVSGEVECPSCKTLFVADPQIIDEFSIQMTCPSCMHHWGVKIESPCFQNPKVVLLTDHFYKNYADIRREVKNWSTSKDKRGIKTYRQFFPCEFQAWDSKGSLEWFFGDRAGYKKTDLEEVADFEVLSKCFINFIALEYLNLPSDRRISSKLETTEVHRKSEVQLKQTDLNAETPVPTFRPSRTPTPEVNPARTLEAKDFTRFSLGEPTYIRRSSLSRNMMLMGLSFLLSLMLMGALFGYFIYQSKLSEAYLARQQRLHHVKTQLISPKRSNPIQKLTNASVTQTKTQPSVEQSLEPVSVTAQNKREQKTAEANPKLAKSAQTDGDIAKRALADANFRQGILHLKLQQSKEAAADFEKVVALDTRNKEAYKNLGLAYIYQKEFKKALYSLRVYLRLSKKSPSEDKDHSQIAQLVKSLQDRVKDLPSGTEGTSPQE